VPLTYRLAVDGPNALEASIEQPAYEVAADESTGPGDDDQLVSIEHVRHLGPPCRLLFARTRDRD
jgi:hypothetical protein